MTQFERLENMRKVLDGASVEESIYLLAVVLEDVVKKQPTYELAP